MKLLASLVGGLAGAVALNVLHESVRHLYPDAPRVDKVGGEALNKLRSAVGAEELSGKELYAHTLAGDVVSNALYFSVAGVSSRNPVAAGTVAGLAAGVGAVCLTKKMGLDDEPINRSSGISAATIAYYTFGGMIAGLAIKGLKKVL